ncbi:glycosyltransferase [Hamadaea tsunoensis]|uniref:glycosyltransferase n=1 Tax=Hamadaea tsunoensis TaxID=53368 RepID=UPI0004820161|nr:glycosyltransferase [Hamadaea tsunoensis]
MTSKRRVVIWRSYLLPASETFVRNQGGALTEWEPTYLGATKVESFIATPSDVIAFPPGGKDFLRLRVTGGSARLRKVLAGLRPDLVHAHFGGDGWLISREAGKVGVPLVITLHGLDVTSQPSRPGPLGARFRRNLRTAFGRATIIIAVSGFIRDKAIAIGADPAKVRVHHTGIPLPEAVPATGEKKWDVIFVGRFVEKKGIDDLIEALGTLPGVRSLFIGTGPLEEGLRARAVELGLDATFLGAQDASVVRASLADAKIFVAPSKTAPNGDSEGLPTTILEAAAQGLPTVSTYHSGIPEAVVPGETGLLGAEGDRAALAASIRTLLGDDAARERMGAAARAYVEEHFDLAKQTRRLEALYDEAVRSYRR